MSLQSNPAGEALDLTEIEREAESDQVPRQQVTDPSQGKLKK